MTDLTDTAILRVGDQATVAVERVAHGGHCVARLNNRVVFVRHGLPGETVRIVVTEIAKRFVRADVVEVLQASAERVPPPCEFAGRCGGCDFQHVTPAGQRSLLTAVVREQLSRLAGIEWSGTVQPVSPDDLGWRTRVNYAIDSNGHAGLRQHRSHHIVQVDHCVIADPRLVRAPNFTWDGESVETIVSGTGQRIVVTDAEPDPAVVAHVDGVVTRRGRAVHGTATLQEVVDGRTFQVTGSGFWQVHPQAAQTLTHAMLAAAQVKPGDHVLDLYSGVGLFSRFLAEQVTSTGRVTAVEGNRVATADAAVNLAGFDHCRVITGPVDRVISSNRWNEDVDLVVLDPPRAGAKNAVHSIARLSPRRIVYVACDPAALARDLATFAGLGYRTTKVEAFALFPMTHHVECVATLVHESHTD